MSRVSRIAAVVAATSGVLLAAALPGVAWAQGANPFVGKWTVTWDGKSRPQQANLEITESGGTWKTLGAKRLDACIWPAAPIEVRSAGAKEIVFTIRFSEVLQGCKDSEVKLTQQDDGRVTGERPGNRDLTLTRR